MSTQRRNEMQPFDPARRGKGRSDARVEAVTNAVMGPLLPVPTAASDDATSWFSIGTVLTLIVVGGCAAAAVAATYGPVFTQPAFGP